MKTIKQDLYQSIYQHLYQNADNVITFTEAVPMYTLHVPGDQHTTYYSNLAEAKQVQQNSETALEELYNNMFLSYDVSEIETALLKTKEAINKVL